MNYLKSTLQIANINVENMYRWTEIIYVVSSVKRFILFVLQKRLLIKLMLFQHFLCTETIIRTIRSPIRHYYSFWEVPPQLATCDDGCRQGYLCSLYDGDNSDNEPCQKIRDHVGNPTTTAASSTLQQASFTSLMLLSALTILGYRALRCL